ncbi:T9SS type A sorting domain-containing protein [Pseudozobellia thermophila]|uniref:Por secretion system C-terminal sorting domain-containing protein n=1 Tax=Pseudozobellia thermophila TaxID=192903 RepID=A0A1M6C2Q4_9FLAO|nr:T9SS type A sorting domain-containing protein [Pseudozobellia thermophila]SHI55233.1 Por secretion system C-terminal sorting domain-containing protein [Pseudozobellia thermophila]
MKRILCYSLFVISYFAVAQSIDRTVIASAGGFLAGPDAGIGFTIGESAVGYRANDLAVDQGFWAGGQIVVVPMFPEEEEVDIVVYPNPVAERLTVFPGDHKVLAMQLFSVDAKRVLMKTTDGSQVRHVIDMGYMAKGVYILQLVLKGKGELKEYKIIKN